MPFSPVLIDVDGLKLALNPAPGLDNPIADDVAVLKDVGVAAVLTTLTADELHKFELDALGQMVEAANLSWFHLPVQDKSLPTDPFDALWLEAQPQLKALLEAGKRVSVHCRGGTGRTGLVAAKLLLSCGADFDTTIEAVRAARPGALSAEAQLDYLRGSLPQP
jgi:protein-tyrosine phosphatase